MSWPIPNRFLYPCQWLPHTFFLDSGAKQSMCLTAPHPSLTDALTHAIDFLIFFLDSRARRSMTLPIPNGCPYPCQWLPYILSWQSCKKNHLRDKGRICLPRHWNRSPNHIRCGCIWNSRDRAMLMVQEKGERLSLWTDDVWASLHKYLDIPS